MTACCRECNYWGNTPDRRLPGTYANCNLVKVLTRLSTALPILKLREPSS